MTALICLSTLALAGGDVAIDPRVVLSDLASIYRDSPRTDDMRISVETLTEKRTERITVRTRPGTGAEITLGPLTLWTDLRTWYAMHDDAPDAYVAIPIEGDRVAGALETEFPPVVAPQIAWMTGERSPSEIGGLANGTVWAHASVFSPCGVAGDLMSCATAQGSVGSRDVSVTLVTKVSGETQFGVIEIRDDNANLAVRAERLDSHAPAKHTLGTPLDGREKLDSLDALLARVPTRE